MTHHTPKTVSYCLFPYRGLPKIASYVSRVMELAIDAPVVVDGQRLGGRGASIAVACRSRPTVGPHTRGRKLQARGSRPIES
jgi:hypothetical protein